MSNTEQGSLSGLRVAGSGMFDDTDEAEVPATPAPSASPSKFVAPARVKTNKYGAKCASCGAWVEPEKGVRTGSTGAWVVTHAGACPEPEAVIEPVERPRRRNTYRKACAFCGQSVEPGEGWLERNHDDSAWIVMHDGTCPSSFPFPAGRYAVTDTADDVLKFYHCVDGGEVYVMASDNEHKLQRSTADRIIALIEADPETASATYGARWKQCGLCGRGLSNLESQKRGIGPWCAQKAGWS